MIPLACMCREEKKIEGERERHPELRYSRDRGRRERDVHGRMRGKEEKDFFFLSIPCPTSAKKTLREKREKKGAGRVP